MEAEEYIQRVRALPAREQFIYLKLEFEGWTASEFEASEHFFGPTAQQIELIFEATRRNLLDPSHVTHV